jgi:2-polyprenyl-6-methoxyphenol hydroxylase-like FAD-dependent oxidoreductase
MAGLVFARVMQKHGAKVLVVERDESAVYRSQGGVLDLHRESGQWALEVAGLTHEFMALARPEGEDIRIVSKDGHVTWEELGEDPSMNRPEIDRPALRKLLVASLVPGTIQWSHKLESIQRIEGESSYRLRFANGREIEAGMVIGADGANSLIRGLVTDARPAYTGVSFVEIGIKNARERFPAVAKLVGRGSLFALSDYKGLIAQLNGDGRIRVYVALTIGAEAFAALSIPSATPERARETLLAQFEDWAPELRQLIEVCDDDTFIPRWINAMPVGLRWRTCGTVTLLGDAAHQMSPFAGAGANVAMQDGAKLAMELLTSQEPAVAIGTYERDMFMRAEDAARESAEGMATCISVDGAHRLAEKMRSYREH